MPTLRELQYGVRLAVLGGDSNAILSAIQGGTASPSARLAVYRNTVQATLAEALQANFPVVVKLVDPRFFAFAASEYLRRDPPTAPVLLAQLWACSTKGL